MLFVKYSAILFAVILSVNAFATEAVKITELNPVKQNNVTENSALTADYLEGKEHYQALCASCHSGAFL